MLAYLLWAVFSTTNMPKGTLELDTTVELSKWTKSKVFANQEPLLLSALILKSGV